MHPRTQAHMHARQKQLVVTVRRPRVQHPRKRLRTARTSTRTHAHACAMRKHHYATRTRTLKHLRTHPLSHTRTHSRIHLLSYTRTHSRIHSRTHTPSRTRTQHARGHAGWSGAAASSSAALAESSGRGFSSMRMWSRRSFLPRPWGPVLETALGYEPVCTSVKAQKTHQSGKAQRLWRTRPPEKEAIAYTQLSGIFVKLPNT
eukprot:6186416-Pleurochrysis_carterae.AAC.2